MSGTFQVPKISEALLAVLKGDALKGAVSSLKASGVNTSIHVDAVNSGLLAVPQGLPKMTASPESKKPGGAPGGGNIDFSN